MKSVIAETYSSLTPKKAKKPENVIKYYCIIEYTHMSLNLKGNLCERLVLDSFDLGDFTGEELLIEVKESGLFPEKDVINKFID